MATRQQQKSEQTRRELMQAGMELFGSQGFASTTVAGITRRAGYAKGSFYRHFESKDELFLDIVEHKLAQYRRARDAGLARAASLEEALRIIWDFLETMVADSNWAKVFLEFTVHAARDEELRATLRHSQYRLSEELFARLIAPFAPRSAPLTRLGALNTALFEGFMIQRALHTGILDLADVREAAVTLARDLAGSFEPGPNAPADETA